MNADLLEIVLLSLRVSGIALFFSTLIGIPLGVYLGLNRFAGRRLLIALLYTGMGFPPVVIGLFVYLMLSRNGPLGGVALPFVPSSVHTRGDGPGADHYRFPAGLRVYHGRGQGVDPVLRQQVRSLGATDRQVALTVISEARLGVVVAVIAGFGGIISEVGAVMMVGGNIDHKTRVLTTAIVLETRKGNFDLAMALGAVLLGLTFLTNLLMLRLQGRAFDE